ncbi:MAG: hypothetical protein ABI334_06450 [Candidatus Dormiibacterota bacterium]
MDEVAEHRRDAGLFRDLWEDGRRLWRVYLAGGGAPRGGLMVGLVVKFKNESTAARIYRDSSTLLGFGPRDLTFIKLGGGTVTTGSDTGLGQRSEVGSASVAGTTYYVAFFQKRVFTSFLIAYDMNSTDAERAVLNVNNRIR